MTLLRIASVTLTVVVTLAGCNQSGLEGVLTDLGSADLADAGAGTCNGRPEVPPDAGLPPPHICQFGDGGTSFPLLSKCCVTGADCASGTYQFSCCGDTIAVGFRKDQSAAFQSAVAEWRCAGCGCSPQGDRAEDGKVIQPGTATVTCDNGWCMTHAP